LGNEALCIQENEGPVQEKERMIGWPTAGTKKSERGGLKKKIQKGGQTHPDVLNVGVKGGD